MRYVNEQTSLIYQGKPWSGVQSFKDAIGVDISNLSAIYNTSLHYRILGQLENEKRVIEYLLQAPLEIFIY